MRANDLLRLYNGIAEYRGIDEPARMYLTSLLRSTLTENESASLNEGLERQERVNFARHHLAMRVTRLTVKERIVARFAVSGETARRAITEALKSPHKRAKNVADKA